MVDLSGYKNPPLMAIGDSLYQGVRSLTIKRELMALSAPRQVAEALGLLDAFTFPDPDRPILIDLERWLRMLTDGGLTAIAADYAANRAYWAADPRSPSKRLAFENIAIASASMEELWLHTSATAQAVIDGLLPLTKGDLRADFTALQGNASRLMQAFNTRFTLNPMGHADLEAFSQFDWVRERAPERLLVNIGSNNGLYEMCFDANPAKRMDFGAGNANLTEFALQLDSLPVEVRHIYVNTLALPRSVANVMPIAPDKEPPQRDYIHEYHHPGPDAYFDVYENRMGFGYGRLTGAELKALDEDVARANAAIREAVYQYQANRDRVRFVNLTKLLLDYDIKHLGQTAGRMVSVRNPAGHSATIELGTKMIDTSVCYRGGGLASLDGMHLTTVGYGVLARKVIEAMEAKEGLDIADIDDQRNFDRDTLLLDPPGIWRFGLWLYRDYRRATDRPAKDSDAVLSTCARAR